MLVRCHALLDLIRARTAARGRGFDAWLLVATSVDARYTGSVRDDDEARSFLIARELIARHGDDVADFLQAKNDELTASGDFERLSVWFFIRNAVALTLQSGSTRH